MANEEHLKILKSGVENWNKWREENKEVIPDLSKADLSGIDLSGTNLRGTNLSKADLRQANLSGTNLEGADLSGANLRGADLTEANLHNANFHRANFHRANLYRADLSGANLIESYLIEANLYKANLSGANLRGANLIEANFTGATLYKADLSKADLREATLSKANLIEANFTGATLYKADLSKADLSDANLSGANLHSAIFREAKLHKTNLSGANLIRADLENAVCIKTNFSGTNIECTRVFGISIWDVNSNGLIQKNLIITNYSEPEITVDSIEVAQFIYLILNNQKLRDVINTITSKSVLILGRFTPERKKILDAIRDKLREYNFVPIMFDFEKADSRDFTETIKTLAGMSRFVIADITNPKSSPLELQALIPDYKIPFLTIIQKEEKPFSMFSDLEQYPWVLNPMGYGSEDELMDGFKHGIIDRAVEREKELLIVKQAPLTILDIVDFKDKS